MADDVRSLAQRTQDATEEIEPMIISIQPHTQGTVDALNSCAEHAAQTLQRANSAAEQQALVARDVDRSLVNIRDLSTQTAAAATETSAAGQELSRLAVDHHGLVTRFVV